MAKINCYAVLDQILFLSLFSRRLSNLYSEDDYEKTRF